MKIEEEPLFGMFPKECERVSVDVLRGFVKDLDELFKSLIEVLRATNERVRADSKGAKAVVSKDFRGGPRTI